MKTQNFLAVLMVMLIVSATAFAQESATYTKEGDLIKVTHYYEGTELVKETGFFKDGVSHGKWVQYNQEGEVQIEAFYNNGKKTGTWFVWTNDGEGLYQLAYENNYLVKSHKWAIEERDLLAENP